MQNQMIKTVKKQTFYPLIKESEEMLLALINQMLLAFKIKTPPYIHGFLIFNHSPGLDYLDMLKYINSEKAFVILSK